MKYTLIPLVLLASAAASAQTTVSDTAYVRSVVPQMERVPVNREFCTEIPAPAAPVVQQGPNVGGAILGTLIGGAIGSRFGGGEGRVAATAAGAGIGAVIGAGAGSGSAVAGPTRECTVQTVYEMQPRGYVVTYDYQGRQYTSRLSYDPGAVLRVNVTVAPAQP